MRYCRREDAEAATKQLNNYQIRPGTFLAVTKSVDNRRLCVKTIPSLSLEITAEEVREELRGLLEGVEGVRFLSTKWLEVEFQSHRMAALARRQLLPGNLTFFRNVAIRQVRFQHKLRVIHGILGELNQFIFHFLNPSASTIILLMFVILR